MTTAACSACAGPLQGRTFQGQSAEVCASCGNVVLTAPVAAILLGRPAELPSTEPPVALDPPPPEADRPEPASGVWPLRLALLLGLCAAFVAVPLLLWVSARNTELEAASSPPPTEEPAVPAATASNVQSLVAKGWTLVADDPAAAADQFRSALALIPRDGAASYGLGYALLRTGDRDGATEHLCRAKSYADRDTSREVASLLEHEGIRCP